MSTRHLLRRTFHRHHSTLTPSPSPPPPTQTPYDRASLSINSKLTRLSTPDPRFLRYTSPHPLPSTFPPHLLSSPSLHLTTLPNGLRIASLPSLASHSASLSIFLDSGSRYEKEDKNGVAYFLEKIILNSRCDGLADVGLELSGVTGRELSGFEGRVVGKDLGKGVDAVGSVLLLQGLDLSENMIENVRQSILAEKEQMATFGQQLVMDQLHATAFQHTPLGRTVQGPADIVKSITKADIQEYILSNCSTHRMVISATGAVKHDEFVELVKKSFTKLSANPSTTSQLVASDPAFFTGSEVRMLDDDLPIASFAVAFEGASKKDPDSIALMVMQQMLGTWTKGDQHGKHVGSQLVQTAAINDIVERFTTFSANYKDTGLFGIYAEAKPDCLDDLGYAIMHEISKMSYRVSDDDVIRARNQLKSSLIIDSHGIGANFADAGQQLLTYGRKIPMAELFARIDAVDASTVKRVANRFLFDKDIAIAARGPIKGLPDYNWFRRRTYWLRY